MKHLVFSSGRPCSGVAAGGRLLLAVLVALLLGAGTATAQITADYHDGNPADWANFTTIYPIHAYSLDLANAAGNVDNQFTQGSKDGNLLTDWHWSNGSANAKGDITNAGALLTGPNNTIMRFFGDRTSDNGDASIGFWFFTTPVSVNANGNFNGVHANGDLLILSDFTSGGTTPTISVYRWNNGALVQLPANNALYAANVNHVTYPAPAGFTYRASNGSLDYAPNLFYEGAIDLAGMNIASCFSYFLVETRNSQSITASLQDFTSGTFNALPPTPEATVVQPSCTVTTGTLNVTDPVLGYVYTLTGTKPVRAAVSNTTGIFAGTLPGDYSLVAAQRTCLSGARSVTVNPQPLTPAAPSLDKVDPTCTVSTGTVTITSATTGLTFSLDNGTYAAYPAGGYTGQAAGPHTVTSKNGDGCISAVASISIGAQPPTPATPTLGKADPTCTLSTGTVTVTSATAGLQFKLDAGSFAAYPAGGYTGLAAGPHTVTAKNTDGCVSPAASITLNAQPPTPTTPTLGKVDPTCAVSTGTVTITSGTTGLTFSLDNGTYAAYPAGGYTGQAAGPHTVTAKNSDGCISPAASITISAQPATPARPVVTIQEATLCGPLTAPKLTVSCPLTGYTYTVTQTGVAGSQTAVYGGSGALEFTLQAGKGFSITTTSPAGSGGCTSAATNCSNYTLNACPVSNFSVSAPSTVSSSLRDIETQAYPNPTSHDATINFVVPQRGHVVLTVYNAMGARIATLFDGESQAGEAHSVVLRGALLASGTYYYKVTANGKTKTSRVLLVK
ncbi:T9SS type A sorting domain-containing protein [Hymenobacter properus]|uniref:T9SS type A sorting domain-containing protein n=1 Tax=Hymenobacter properus TaxID=2791026 RepID=A0A931FHJ4_9BACT|nr:T9SS type A sorting domain-containing protein [Hymenobacter properus]MBF9141132.1 T9SS type A sorting domain-containing protein [Hymenobacter properus]MBR7719941.1 T9SS type A sorting domain-containing protein [Microvirga sp. SRT04]